MKKKRSIIFGTGLSLVLVSIILVAAVAPAMANSGKNRVTYYSNGGSVVIQLPTAGGTLANRPTALKITVNENSRYSTFGAADFMQVQLWVSSLNRFVAVAIIRDDPDPDSEAIAFAKELFKGSPVWNPATGMKNVFSVENAELEVVVRNDMVTVNLTKAVDIVLNGTLAGLSFTLPPLTLTFRGIDDVYSEPGSTVTLAPSPPLSGYTVQTIMSQKPAWVNVEIPTWVGGSSLNLAGVMEINKIQTATPP
jgi:hypothetical protein